MRAALTLEEAEVAVERGLEAGDLALGGGGGHGRGPRAAAAEGSGRVGRWLRVWRVCRFGERKVRKERLAGMREVGSVQWNNRMIDLQSLQKLVQFSRWLLSIRIFIH